MTAILATSRDQLCVEQSEIVSETPPQQRFEEKLQFIGSFHDFSFFPVYFHFRLNAQIRP